MKFIRHHITHTSGWYRKVINPILAVAMAVITAACGNDGSVYYTEPDLPHEVEKANIYLTLNVKVSNNHGYAGRSRVAADDNNYYFEQPVLANEKLQELRVIIVRENNTIEAHRKVEYNKEGVLNTDYITFKLTPGYKRIYLIGNESSLPADVQQLIAKGDEITPYFLDSDILSRAQDKPFYYPGQNIPMTEVFEIILPANKHDEVSDDTDYESNDDITYVYKELFITRIATKYTIITPEDLASLKITLSDIATKQYLLPHRAVYYPGKYEPAAIIDGIAGRSIVAFDAPDKEDKSDFEIELSNENRVKFTDSDGIEKYRYESFYLMETSGSKFSISALINSEMADFSKEYDAVTLPNLPLLPRNTHVVINMSFKHEVNADVQIVPYTGVWLNPQFGIDRE